MHTSIFQKQGKYLMLALDHRGSFRKYVNPANPQAATDQELIKIKALIIEALQDQFSGVLIDADWGLKAYRAKNKPYLLPLEKSGYVETAGERVTELEYTAAQIKKMGASGAKLLLYFNPEAKNCVAQMAVAKHALADARQNSLPFFLEIVTYGNEEPGKSRAEWVLRSLEMLLDYDVVPDVWKLEYPTDAESCGEVTKLVGQTPWILLTRGEKFAVFEKQLSEAVAGGAVGFLAGRALWQEIAEYQTDAEKEKFLNKVVADRFRQISEVCLS